MSVYTLLSQNQLRDILEKYELGKIESIEEISDGIENSNYLIKTWQQHYVLTIFEQHQEQNLNPFFSFMAAAEKKGFPFPCPLKNRLAENLSFFEYQRKKKAFIVCKKLEGKHPSHINEQLCAELGKQFAAIHLLSQDESVKRLFPFSGLSFVIPVTPLDFLDEEKQRLLEKQKTLVQTLSRDISAFPSGICHCDFFPDNALIINDGRQQKFSGFLDWYDARNTVFILDLAIIAVSWCKDNNNTLNGTKITALLEAYQMLRPLTDIEKQHWNHFLEIAATIFWLSRECYMQKMEKDGKEAKSNKRAEEFYQLLLNMEGL